MEKCSYFAGINAAGGSQSWKQSKELQALMINSVVNSKQPIFFFQAENDYDLSPSKVLAEAMKKANKAYKLKIYPAFGNSSKEGHSFPYKGTLHQGCNEKAKTLEYQGPQKSCQADLSKLDDKAAPSYRHRHALIGGYYPG